MVGSGSSQVPQNRILTNANVDFWADDNVDIGDDQVSTKIPDLPVVDWDIQIAKGVGADALAYYALQVVKSRDKLVIMRAIAAACSVLLKDNTNYTGSATKVVDLTGLDAAGGDSIDDKLELHTNFIDAEPVTVGELLDLLSADPDELGSYFGVLFLAGNKRVNTKNRTAFNEKRTQAATASIIGTPKIFVADSPYLTDQILGNVYAAFLSCAAVRARMTARVITQLPKTHMMASLAFVNMFLLLRDSGMSALRMIKEACVRYDWIRTEFVELKPEFIAANRGLQLIRTAPLAERSFLKAIHGNNFVPVKYTNIDNLLGVCKEILIRTVPTYRNYEGGKTLPNHRERIEKYIKLNEIATTDSVQAE
jgi:hypothetical protein